MEARLSHTCSVTFIGFGGDDFLLLKIDFENAFNMVSRKAFLEVVYNSFPAIYEWVQFCYGSPSHLLFGDSLISSSSGVQQGDPIGPFLFCLALDKIVRSIERDCDLETNKWYLDDGALSGDADEILKALDIIRKDGPAVGTTRKHYEVRDLWHASGTARPIQGSHPTHR